MNNFCVITKFDKKNIKQKNAKKNGFKKFIGKNNEIKII